jgi:inner membrane protein involved in colicin E2 resistance
MPDTSKSDGGSALPRATTGERSTIFGLSPTAAVLIGAALLLVVILAIVAMTRNADQSRIDIDTRPRV